MCVSVNLELLLCKSCFNLMNIFALGQFKMVGNEVECSRLEQNSAFKILVADKSKPCAIYRRMFDVYWKADLSKNCQSKVKSKKVRYEI